MFDLDYLLTLARSGAASSETIAPLINAIVEMHDELRRLDRERGMIELDRQDAEPASANVLLEDRRAAVVRAAHHAVALQIKEVWGLANPDANSERWINDAILSPRGLGWSSAEWGPGARPGVRYRDAMDPATHRPRKFQWCGAAAAVFQAAAGLDPYLLSKAMAGTGRLMNVSGPPSSDPKFNRLWRPDPARRRPPDEAQPGHVLVMGPEGSLVHIETVVQCVLQNNVLVGYITVGGNTVGRLQLPLTNPQPRHQGVAYNFRPLRAPDARTYRVHHTIAFTLEDYTQGISQP